MKSDTAGFILRRLGASVLLLFLVLSFTFLFLHLAPGDPTVLAQDPRLSSDQRQSLRRVYGLDRPLADRYLHWLRATLLEGDWGTSFVHSRPVTAVVAEHAPATLLLAGAGLMLQYGLGLLAGMAAARRAGGRADHLIRVTALTFYCLPIFWTGLMALLLFSYSWPLFPPGHMLSVGAASLPPLARAIDLLQHLALPALVLGLAAAGATARFARTSLLEILGQDYIRTARAKGLSEAKVVWVHAWRNAAAPLIQLFGLSLPLLLSGSLIVEVVFSWPGLGRLTFQSILSRDYPVILATTALTGTLVVAGNLLADLLQAAVDPRVRA
jgi:peptide/nickel transport system permease protein